MPFRRQRSHPAALIAVCAALWLAGCSLPRTAPDDAGAQPPAPGADAPASGPIWRVIDGGLRIRSVLPGQIGDMLTGPIQVRFTRPVAVAARGHLLYIVDGGDQRLYRYDTDIDRLTVLKELRDLIGGEVSDIYVTPELEYYLADADGGRVLHFDRDNTLVRVFQDDINIGRPVSVYVNDATGYVFIADGFNDDVLVYNRAGLLEGAIGRRGQGAGAFRGITGFAQGPEGYYVATRYGTHRVQVMAFDGSYVASFEKDTVTFPTAIAVAGDGRAFVADYLADDIKVFANGAMIGTLGGHGSAPGRFRRITDLWLDGGFLYAADSLNGRVQALPLASMTLGVPTGP